MINTTQPIHTATIPDQVVVRALSSITIEQANSIADIVGASGQAWDVQAVDDYDGYLSILIEPTVGSDEQKALFVSGTAHHLELFETHEDELMPIGTFSDAKALGARLTEIVSLQ